MKNILSILFSIVLLSNVTGQGSNEIKAIENGLMKSIQIKGKTIQTFNIIERMEFYKVPGVSIAIIENGTLKWAKGYGYANTETGTKVDTETLFQAGSISKPIAAMAALKLYDEDQVALDTDVNRYLKTWKVPQSRHTSVEKVTLEKLLTHTAGMTVHGFPGYQQQDTFPPINDVLNGEGNTGKIEVDTLPGSIWRYSGGGYTVMEKVVEDVSGLPLEDFLEQHILHPMGMKNSTYQQPISEKYQHNISAAYDRGGALIKGLWNNYPEQAAAGLWTTPSELAQYIIAIQRIKKGKTDGVLSPETVDLMLTKHKNGWGLGPSLQNEGDSLLFGHGGKNAGFTNNMIASVHNGYGVIVMTNADNGGALITEIENAVTKHYGWPVSEINEIEVIEMSDAQLLPFTGKYELKERGLTINMEIVDNHLSAMTPVGKLHLLPLSETLFIDVDSGSRLEFTKDEKVTGIVVNGRMVLDKIE